MSDSRTIIDITVDELTQIFEHKAHEVATTFATTKIQEAVKEGCLEVFKDFGFDTAHPEESAKNQMYLTRSRLSAEKVTTAVKVSLALAVVTVVVGAVSKFIKVVCPQIVP